MKSASYLGPIFALSTILSACSVGNNVSGLSPVLKYADVQASTSNYAMVRDAFIVRAGYAPNSAVDWYEVTRAGFDYIDEQCSTYLSALYDARRARDATTRQLQSLDGATSAILGFANAGSQAILITAAAFGLATQSVDNASSAMLYAMDPTDIQALLRSQSTAYRIGVSSQSASYRTGTAAMEAIRGYLNLCLPVSIEAQIRAAVQGTQYVASPTNYGVPALARVQTASANVQAMVPSRPALVGSPVPVPATPAADALAKGLQPGDVTITAAELMALQKRLCVKADGNIGGDDSETRSAIKMVEYTKGRPQNGKLDDRAKSDITSMTDCDVSIHQTAYEHIFLATEGEGVAVKKEIRAHVDGSNLFSAEIKALVAKPDFIQGDALSADNRAVIAAIQSLKPGMVADGKLTPSVHDLL
ncbi:MAG: hypothetical protein ACOH2N_07390 [Devosia sp.]